MNHFNKFLNTGGMVIFLMILVVFFGSLDSYGINHNNEIPAERTIPVTAPIVRNDVALQNDKIIKALDNETFVRLIQSSEERPVFFMIYASWCPHCKRMFHELNGLQQQYGDAIDIVTISIDNNPMQAKQFINSMADIYLDTYIVKNGASYHAMGEKLRGYGLRFTGGTGKSTAVPYNVVFYKNNPVAEIAGALPTENLKATVKDIATNAGKS